MEGQKKAVEGGLTWCLKAWRYEYLMSLETGSGYSVIPIFGAFVFKCGNKL